VLVELAHLEVQGALVLAVLYPQVLLVSKVSNDSNICEVLIIESVEEVTKEGLPRESALNVEEEQNEAVKHVFVDEELDEVGKADGEGAAVPEKEASQVSERGDGKVGKSCRLVAFFTEEPHSYVSLLNHIDVVCSVSDGQSYRVLNLILDEAYNISFLFRAASVGNNSLSSLEDLN
jgi:hypothetical protein